MTWSTRRLLAACLAAAALLALPFLGARDLWAPDEPRYAQVAQEMLADGHWWYPHVNSREYPDKPPLYFWLAAAAGAPLGHVSEGAARLPSALAHVLLVALTFALGLRFFGPLGATVAAAALATTWIQAWMARRACLDVLLTLCVMLTVLAALKAGDAGRSGAWAGRLAWSAAAGIACGLGVMTKGPVLLLAVAGALLPVLLSASARRERAPGLAKGLAAAVLAFALVLTAWLVPAWFIGGYDPLAVTQEHVVMRAAEGMHHAQPPWYFLLSAPLDFLPWTPVALLACAWGWRQRHEWPQAMLLGWALFPLLVHSLIVEKRNIYMLPTAPAWALLCGGFIASLDVAPRLLRRVLWGLVAALALLGMVTLVAPWISLRGDAAEALALPGVKAMLVVLGLAAAAGAMLLAGQLRLGARPVRLALSLALAFGMVEAAVFGLLPLLDPLKSGRAMGEIVSRETHGAPAAMYPRTWDAYVYYSGRSITDMGQGEQASAWLARVPRPAYVLAYEKDLDELPLDGATQPRRVHAADVGHRRLHLLQYSAPPE